MGAEIPVWDQRDEFGDTNLLVREPAEGVSLARALGKNHMVLMRRHGATVVAESLRQLVFRSIYSCRNAEYQTLGRMVGEVSELTPGEIEKAGELHRAPNTVARAWEYWSTRLANRGGMPPRQKRSRVAARKPAAKKKSKQGKRR
jgi:HCOMODA/2-hydroxy-3-carboxy-muconic semialdehyde decarboxylase